MKTLCGLVGLSEWELEVKDKDFPALVERMFSEFLIL